MEMVPPWPAPEVSVVAVACCREMEEPFRSRRPPLPEPWVWAVMRPAPVMAREADGVPMVMVPPWPPPGPTWVVLALMRESPEKAMASGRGVVALRLITPPFAIPVVCALI